MFWIFFFIPLMGFAEQNETPFGSEWNSSQHEQRKKEISFETTIPVHVEVSYPVFLGKGKLIEHVNQELQAEAEDRFAHFVKEELFTNDEGEDETRLDCTFFPVYQKVNLISIGGCKTQIRGSRGGTCYEGKTFWNKGDAVVQLALDDLFVEGSGHRQFLLQYCENYFTSSGYGYYSSCSELEPELCLDDLDIFVLTDKGLMIVFRPYTVGGGADGPDIVLIPYTDLNKFIDPCGPLQEVFNTK